MKKILIAGIPATRKTTMGTYLEKHHGFRHFNVESADSDPASKLGRLFWLGDIDTFLSEIGDTKDIVITWGFACNHQNSLNIIKKLQEQGFRFIWFFANEFFARAAYIERLQKTGEGDIDAFNTQMRRIDKLDLNIFKDPMIIETSGAGGLKTEEEIVKEIFEAQ